MSLLLLALWACWVQPWRAQPVREPPAWEVRPTPTWPQAPKPLPWRERGLLRKTRRAAA